MIDFKAKFGSDFSTAVSTQTVVVCRFCCRDCFSVSAVSFDMFVRLAVMALSLDFPATTCDDSVLLRGGAFPVNRFT